MCVCARAAYFTDTSLSDMVHTKVPLHSIIQLEPACYDCNTTVHEIGPHIPIDHPAFTPKQTARTELDDEESSDEGEASLGSGGAPEL